MYLPSAAIVDVMVWDRKHCTVGGEEGALLWSVSPFTRYRNLKTLT